MNEKIGHILWIRISMYINQNILKACTNSKLIFAFTLKAVLACNFGEQSSDLMGINKPSAVLWL